MACTVGTLMLPHNAYIRYQSFADTIFADLTWIYERAHYDDRPIDVVILGSSREGRSSNSPQIEEQLAARKHPMNVVNISIPASGYDVRLTELRELLSCHKIKLVVFGVVECLPRDGHQGFGDLGTVTEILTAPKIVNRNLPEHLAHLPYRQLELSVASLVPEAFGYRRNFDSKLYAGPNLDNRKRKSEQDPPEAAPSAKKPSHKDALQEESNRRKRQITKPVLPARLSFIEFGVSQTYIKELMALSKQHNFEVVFLFQPFYDGYEQPIDLACLEQFGPVWRATFLKVDPKNYLDAAHCSEKAADELSGWLADRIVKHFEARK